MRLKPESSYCNRRKTEWGILFTGERQRAQLAHAVRNRTRHGRPSRPGTRASVRTLLNVFQHLVEQGATVVVIEHDLDFIRNADYVVDMGPGGGQAGGRVVAHGTPAQIAQNPASLTGSYL